MGQFRDNLSRRWYSQGMQNEDQTVVTRFYTPKAKKLWKAFGLKASDEVMFGEHVYFDTGHPSVFYTGFVRARRVASDDVDLFDEGAKYYMEVRLNADEATRCHPEEVTLSELAVLAREEYDLGDLVPVLGVRFERLTGETEEFGIAVDHDTTYFSMLGDEPFEVGRELTPRVILRRLDTPEVADEIAKTIESLDTAPCTAKKWMGFHYLKSCYELPRRDELAGYEYELKLDVESLLFDLGLLPFPVLEVHQSDSLRRYYQDYRACLRGDSAHLVEKGPVVSIGGVLKREEVKRRGLSAWELPEAHMVMRRYKREVSILNPDTGRVYTLSLHHCDAGETFQQVEIEYDGRLVPGAVTEMARFRADHKAERFLRLAAKADAVGWGEVGNTLRTRYLDLAGDAGDKAVVKSSMSKSGDGDAPVGDPRVEEEVVEDMLLLRNALLRQGLRPSRITKRKWLRRVYAERDE